MTNHRQAARLALQSVRQTGLHVDGVGHRFVHGGSYFHKSVVLDEIKIDYRILYSSPSDYFPPARSLVAAFLFPSFAALSKFSAAFT
jgi:hypothetical protein